MASLADFCKGREATPSVSRAWLYPEKKLVCASNGFLVIARTARRGERLKPAPPEVKKVFQPWISFRPSRKARVVLIRDLRRFAGRGIWPKEGSLCRPGRVNGQLLNCNWLALLLGRVTDARGKIEIQKTDGGSCFSLVSKHWIIHLMGLMESALGEGQVVPAFRA